MSLLRNLDELDIGTERPHVESMYTPHKIQDFLPNVQERKFFVNGQFLLIFGQMAQKSAETFRFIKNFLIRKVGGKAGNSRGSIHHPHMVTNNKT